MINQDPSTWIWKPLKEVTLNKLMATFNVQVEEIIRKLSDSVPYIEKANKKKDKKDHDCNSKMYEMESRLDKYEPSKTKKSLHSHHKTEKHQNDQGKIR